MRLLIFVLLFSSSFGWAASADEKIQQLAVQVAPLWRAMKPVCEMALDNKVLPAAADRIDFLNANLVASNLVEHVQTQAKPSANKAWSATSWQAQARLEKAALEPAERDALREYYFKLQTQTPNPERVAVVEKIAYMSESLNLALREGMWKTCYAIGFSDIEAEQLEKAVQQHWITQEMGVRSMVKNELAAFHFYAFRQVQQQQLDIMANVSEQLKAWADLSAEQVRSYFTQLRANMLSIPLLAISPSIDAPFLSAPLENQAPFPSLPRP